MNGRRDFLRGIGSSMFVGGLGLGSGLQFESDDIPRPAVGAAGPANDEQLPVDAVGVLSIEYERRTEGTFLRTETFRSPDLRERYGDPRFEYEPIEVPERIVPTAVAAGTQSTFETRTRKVIGTQAEHRVAERRIWERRETRTLPNCPANLENRIPLYHYESEKKAQEVQLGSKVERKAPINVCWVGSGAEAIGAETIKESMENPDDDDLESWERTIGAGPIEKAFRLYAEKAWWVEDVDHHIYDARTDEVLGVDADVANGVSVCPMKQFHVRLYELDRSEPVVIGQAHQDPCDHNQTAGWSGEAEETIDEHSNQSGEVTGEKLSELLDERAEDGNWEVNRSTSEPDRTFGVYNPWRFALAATQVESWWRQNDGFDSTDCDVDNNEPDPHSSTAWQTHDGKIRYIYQTN